MTTSTISNCKNYGNINGKDTVGGISGTMVRKNASNSWSKSVVEKCYNSGNVTGNNYIGGIVGAMGGDIGNGTVNKCFNKGKISGSSSVGEIVGNITCTTLVSSIVENEPGNLLTNLLYLKGINNLPPIGNYTLTGEQPDTFNIKPTNIESAYDKLITEEIQ